MYWMISVVSGFLVSLREKASTGNMHTVCTFYQRVGNYAHLTVGTVLSFERGVELVH